MELVRKLGREVWLANHAVYGRVVVKRATPREARITALAGAVRVLAIATDQFVMELADGEPLDARIRRLGRLPLGDAIAIARRLCRTLASLHARGIVHHDVKPENVVGATLIDFGSASAPGEPAAPPSGTPAYMAPERDRDARADIYSFGCVLFAMLAGRPPFLGSPRELIAQHASAPAPRLSELLGGISPALDALVARCLEKAPRSRFASSRELARALATISTRGTPYPLGSLEALPIAATTLSVSALALEPAIERRLPRAAVGLAVVAASALAILTGMRIAERAAAPAPAAAAATSSCR
ncbi:MAG TPA: serine/threonine-protein kinase [Kofleriaceae bacterium]